MGTFRDLLMRLYSNRGSKQWLTYTNYPLNFVHRKKSVTEVEKMAGTTRTFAGLWWRGRGKRGAEEEGRFPKESADMGKI
jgi:hypothetical protein